MVWCRIALKTGRMNMKKVLALGFILTLFPSPLAHAVEAVAVEASAVGAVVDAGNKTCPVGGEEVSGKDFVEYQGKKYGLCCPMCAAKFNKDPEKYLAELSKKQESKEPHDHSMSM